MHRVRYASNAVVHTDAWLWRWSSPCWLVTKWLSGRQTEPALFRLRREPFEDLFEGKKASAAASAIGTR